ncbi:MAG: MarR family transcriptional regulator [Pseudomonadota bacterium]
MSTPKRQRPTIRLHEFVPYQLSVTAGRMTQAINGLFERKYQFQIPEWRILMTLAENGALSAHEVADKSSMDRARVSRAQRRMADLELITVTIDDADRRRTILDLTEKGWGIVETIVPDADRTGEWLLDGLSDEERTQLNSLLTKLLRRTDELPDQGFAD